MLFQVQLDVVFFVEILVANWTIGSLTEPVVDAISMENVETTQHLALRII